LRRQFLDMPFFMYPSRLAAAAAAIALSAPAPALAQSPGTLASPVIADASFSVIGDGNGGFIVAVGTSATAFSGDAGPGLGFSIPLASTDGFGPVDHSGRHIAPTGPRAASGPNKFQFG